MAPELANNLSEATPAVSASTLKRLQEQTGDDDGELLRELVEVFVMDAQETCERMPGLLEAGSIDELAREAHRLKSGAANMGAGRMTELCKSIETQGNHKQLEGMAELLTELPQELTRVAAALQDYLDTL